MCGGPDIFQQAGDALAGVDKTVNDVIPGGWVTVAALTGGGLALAYAPEVMAFAEANGITPAAASESLGIAPVDAVTGQAVAPDVFAGLSANAPVDTTLSQAAADSLAASGGAGAGSAVPGAFTDANLGYTGAAQELGLEGSSTGLTDLSGTQGSAMLDSMGLNSSGLTANDILNGVSKANQIKNLATTGYNLINGQSNPTGLSTLYGTTTGGTGAGTSSINAPSNPTNYQGTFVKGSQIESPLSNFAIPVNNYASPVYNPNQLQEIAQAAEGGIMHPVHLAEGGDPIPEGFFKPWKPVQSRGQKIQGHPGLTAFHGVGLKTGGEPSMQEAHNPQFFSEGGLNAIQHRYVTGAGDGTSDSIPAMLANGEFVIPADVVSSLGNGSNDSGAEVLDSFLKTIREHKQKHNAKHLPPDSKGPLAYLLEAKHKARS